MSDLKGIVERIRSRVARNLYPNETAVRTQIVQPVLEVLGWDVYDPEKVCPEYPLRPESGSAAPRPVDLALCAADRSPRCIVELRSTTVDLDEVGRSGRDRKLLEDAVRAGAPLALLTNGVKWRFYSTRGAGTDAERPVVKDLDLKVDPLEEVTSDLERYLSWSNTASGRSAEFARDDLEARLNRERTREALSRAWAQLAETRLPDLLAETTRALTGSRPEATEVARFLSDLEPGRGDDADGAVVGPLEATSWDGRTVRGPVRYWLLGEEHVAEGRPAEGTEPARRPFEELYATVLSVLAERDSGFLARVEPRFRRRKERGVARSKHKLSPYPSRAEISSPLPGGWWLNQWVGDHWRIDRLKIACEVAGVPFEDRAGLHLLLPPKSEAPPGPGLKSARRHGPVHYWLFGREHEERSAKDAYVAVFAGLAEQDSGFLERVAPRLPGRTHLSLAPTIQQLSPDGYHRGRSVRLPSGWWLHTNLTNAEKTRRLKIACEVAGIPFGDRAGLDIRLPNA